MILPDMISNLRIELQDQAQVLYLDSELTRAIEKSVSLMSRMNPKRCIAETTITRTITAETLVITGSTGTLAYKPVKKNSVTITGKVLDTDYRINYMTGVITEIGALLPDASYTVTYTLDQGMLDLSTFLTDWIKLERVEYPVGDSPATLLTFDLYGNILVVRGSTLLDNNHMRIIYLGKWTPPTLTAVGDYPSNLDDPVIIGSSGQALIYKAEKYTQAAVTAIEAITTSLATIPAVPTITSPTVPTSPTLATLVAPSGYLVVAPTPPTLATAPTAPTAPTLSFTDVSTALTAIGTEITAAKAHHTTGAALANAATRGESPADVYAKYADTIMSGAGHRVNEAIAQLRIIEENLTKYSGQVTSYGSDVNAYANTVSGQIGKYREEVNAQMLGIQNVQANSGIYAASIQNNNTLVNKYQAEIQSYQAKSSDNQVILNKYIANVNAVVNANQILITQVANYLDIAGRYLASGQSKINEMLTALGVKAEFLFQKSSSEQR